MTRKKGLGPVFRPAVDFFRAQFSGTNFILRPVFRHNFIIRPVFRHKSSLAAKFSGTMSGTKGMRLWRKPFVHPTLAQSHFEKESADSALRPWSRAVFESRRWARLGAAGPSHP